MRQSGVLVTLLPVVDVQALSCCFTVCELATAVLVEHDAALQLLESTSVVPISHHGNDGPGDYESECYVDKGSPGHYGTSTMQ